MEFRPILKPFLLLLACLNFSGVWGRSRELPDIRCYRCNGTTRDCDWDTETVDCEEPFDMCVTIIEKKLDYVHFTQDCLSRIDDYRKDLPLNRGRGCRPAKRVTTSTASTNALCTTPKTNNDSDINYDEVTFCFCRYSDECNNSGHNFRFRAPQLAILALILYSVVS